MFLVVTAAPPGADPASPPPVHPAAAGSAAATAAAAAASRRDVSARRVGGRSLQAGLWRDRQRYFFLRFFKKKNEFEYKRFEYFHMHYKVKSLLLIFAHLARLERRVDRDLATLPATSMARTDGDVAAAADGERVLGEVEGDPTLLLTIKSINCLFFTLSTHFRIYLIPRAMASAASTAATRSPPNAGYMPSCWSRPSEEREREDQEGGDPRSRCRRSIHPGMEGGKTSLQLK